MTNEHNPIAIRINHLQDLWMEHRQQKPKARLIRWLVSPDDAPLVNGFYKLESSVHGKIEESLIVMLTDFQNIESFSYQITKDWLNMYEKALEEYPNLAWDEFSQQKEAFQKIDAQKQDITDNFWVEMLKSFKKNKQTKNFLFVGINPRKVYHAKNFNLWCEKIIQQLSDNIGIVLVDYKGGSYHDKLFHKRELENILQTIIVKDQNMRGAQEQLMTQGNPNDPQVAFRTCMVEMGKATSKNKLSELHKWGQKGLNITQATGQKSFWVSAHLVYAGYLFQFKDSATIHKLLDKGIQIGKSDSKDKNLAGITLQIYGYKGAYHSMCGEKEQAFEAFLTQAQQAVKKEENILAISAYKNTLIVGELHQMHTQFKEVAIEAFEFGDTQDDELIKNTEFIYIAKSFLDTARIQSDREEEIELKLKKLFGENWREEANKIKIEIPEQEKV